MRGSRSKIAGERKSKLKAERSHQRQRKGGKGKTGLSETLVEQEVWPQFLKTTQNGIIFAQE